MNDESTATDAGAAPEVPRLLAGRYVLGEPLGRGGMGVVYRCTDRQTGEERAAKLLTDRLLADAEETRRFQQEARLMTHFQHPHILRVDDFGIEGQTPFLISELCVNPDGQPASLGDVQAAAPDRRVAPELVARWLPPVLGALADLHASGLVHRDLKPSNILLRHREDGPPEAKLADFGLVAITGDAAMRQRVDLSLSMQVEQESAEARALVGTYSYMSPEQKQGEVLDARSDVYSFGLMLYRLITGYERVTFALPSQVVPEAPAWIDDIVKASVEIDKEERAASAEVLYELLPAELRAACPRSPLPARQPTPEPVPVPVLTPLPSEVALKAAPNGVSIWLRRMTALIAFTAVVAVAVTALVWLRLQPAGESGQVPPTAAPGLSLREQLSSRSPEVLRAGLQAWRNATADQAAALQPLVLATLTHPDPDVHRLAVRTVAEAAINAPALRPAVLPYLADADEAVVSHLLATIPRWPEPDAAAVGAVHGVFQRAGGHLRLEAAAALDALPMPRDPAYADYFLYRGKAADLARIGPTAVPALLEALAGDHRAMQLTAIESFRAMGPAGAPAVAELVPLLNAEDRDLRQPIEEALLAIGQPAIAPLIDLLTTGSPYGKRAATTILAQLGPAPTAIWAPWYVDRAQPADIEPLLQIGEAAVPALIAALTSGIPGQRDFALTALQGLGPKASAAAEPLARILHDEFPLAGGKPILDTLAAIGPAASGATGILLDLLAANTPQAAQVAAVLDRIGVQLEPRYLPYFLYRLKSARTPEARNEAASALGSLGRGWPAARAALIELLRHADDPALVAAVVQALGRVGRGAVRDLQLLLDDCALCAPRVLLALGALGPDADSAIPTVVQLVRQGDPELRPLATRTLGKLGPNAIGPLLDGPLHSEALRESAAEALAEIGEPALLVILNQLQSGRDRDRANALYALGFMSRHADRVVPALLAALGENWRADRQEAILALGRLGPAATDALPTLSRLAQPVGAGNDLNRAAIQAMAAIGEAAVPHLADLLATATGKPAFQSDVLQLLAKQRAAATSAVPQVIKVFAASQNAELRRLIAKFLTDLGPAAKEAVPALTAALTDDDFAVRLHAVEALGAIGPAARPAIPRIREVSPRNPPIFQQAAEKALKAIGNPP